MKCITLLTDFGTADGYVGALKGVLVAAAPSAQIIDITHDVPPHDTELARLTVARYWRRFPEETVHLVVVDPGVGSDRAALAVSSDGRFLVGPDNGVLSPALLFPGTRAVRLSVPRGAAPTFHGRDVFAPAAARLAKGEALESIGDPMDDPIIHRTPEPHSSPNGDIVGQVIAIDRFGNAITNILGGLRPGSLVVNGKTISPRRTYADLNTDEAGAIVGSSGLIEIAVREGRAADVLNIRRGDEVVLRSA